MARREVQRREFPASREESTRRADQPASAAVTAGGSGARGAPQGSPGHSQSSQGFLLPAAAATSRPGARGPA